MILDGHHKVLCRRVRQKCGGVYACEHADPRYLNIAQYDLDLDAHEELIAAQIQARAEEASSADKLTIMLVLPIMSIISTNYLNTLTATGTSSMRAIVTPLNRAWASH